ncbi:hypothetical protein EI42_05422 [Thermosporothrix hazakensis]|jgi:hypothetical protein|uniref:Uncharacterized protein n=1 Tax=Thermosporothrix hazakensis TaxID=644383 RepID=A0A326UBT2_THEHA|nr:hypothetical protein [Thermosporothrix hazakensis]PZW22516.1 hypothetical protein EI42_05422 [Thermosporothrix hazakensis]GCE50205.1 hypothetical protein KTH_50740 [Thermosporothrix hazakensis]
MLQYLWKMPLHALLEIAKDAVQGLIQEFHALISAYRQEENPERRKAWGAMVRDRLRWLKEYRVPKALYAAYPWIQPRSPEVWVEFEKHSEPLEPLALEQLMSMLKQFARQQQKHLYLSLCCTHTSVRTEGEGHETATRADEQES